MQVFDLPGLFNRDAMLAFVPEREALETRIAQARMRQEKDTCRAWA